MSSDAAFLRSIRPCLGFRLMDLMASCAPCACAPRAYLGTGIQEGRDATLAYYGELGGHTGGTFRAIALEPWSLIVASMGKKR